MNFTITYRDKSGEKRALQLKAYHISRVVIFVHPLCET